MLLTPGFAALALSTFGIHLMTQGVFQSLFPIQSTTQAGLTNGQVGTLISIASVVTLIFALPNGFLIDRFGRKPALVPGLFLLAFTAVLLSISRDYSGALMAALVYGIAQAMTTGASQTFAMDLAPPDRRGAFLGVWSISQNLGSFTGPLVAGAIVDTWGFGPAFLVTAAWIGASAVIMAVWGPETRPGGKAGPR
jgi:MFS family permease